MLRTRLLKHELDVFMAFCAMMKVKETDVIVNNKLKDFVTIYRIVLLNMVKIILKIEEI